MSEYDHKYLQELHLLEQFGVTAPSTFPHHLVIPDRQWMHEFIRGIVEFYESHSDEEIADLNTTASDWWTAQITQSSVLSDAPRLPEAGYVYLMRQGATSNYKIGYTKNPQNRLKSFKSSLPFKVEYECLITTADMRGLEQRLHARFNDKHVNGEWFGLAAEDVAYIKSLEAGA